MLAVPGAVVLARQTGGVNLLDAVWAIPVAALCGTAALLLRARRARPDPLDARARRAAAGRCAGRPHPRAWPRLCIALSSRDRRRLLRAPAAPRELSEAWSGADRDHALDREARSRGRLRVDGDRGGVRRGASRGPSRASSASCSGRRRPRAPARTLARRLALEAVEDAGLGRDQEALLRRARAKSIIFSVERMCVRSLPNAIAWLAQPHSGWTSSSASGASPASARCRPGGCPRGRGTRPSRWSACGR